MVGGSELLLFFHVDMELAHAAISGCTWWEILERTSVEGEEIVLRSIRYLSSIRRNTIDLTMIMFLMEYRQVT